MPVDGLRVIEDPDEVIAHFTSEVDRLGERLAETGDPQDGEFDEAAFREALGDGFMLMRDIRQTRRRAGRHMEALTKLYDRAELLLAGEDD